MRIVPSETLSVVLATYNGARHLSSQLRSIAAQTRLPEELIVSDDNSTDATTQIVTDFAKTAAFPVKLRRNNPGLGFRDNFLSACAHAKGDWIAFCDQDDVWREDKLAECQKVISNPSVTAVVHQAVLIDDKGLAYGRFDQGIRKTAIRRPLTYDVWGTFWGFSMVVRRSILEIVSPDQRFVDYIDPRYAIAHDRWAFFMAQTLGCVAEIAEPLVAYRQHDGNVFGASRRRGQIENRDAVLAEQAPYLSSTRDMLRIVRTLPEGLETQFPAFDRERAEAVFARAVEQQELRNALYLSPRGPAILAMLKMLAQGRYRSATNGMIRWHSVAKDLIVVLKA